MHELEVNALTPRNVRRNHGVKVQGITKVWRVPRFGHCQARAEPVLRRQTADRRMKRRVGKKRERAGAKRACILRTVLLDPFFFATKLGAEFTFLGESDLRTRP